MERVVLALVLIAAAVVVALVLQRRRPEVAAAPSFAAPERVDRMDFGDVDRPWLLIAFTSGTCSTCAEVVEVTSPLAGGDLGFAQVELSEARELHERYGIGAVPLLLLADAEGVVRHHVFGPVSRREIEAVLAEIRGGT
jgi:hypothetical protein